MSDQDRRQEDGVPPLTPADTEQPGRQQADVRADPLSQNLFHGRDEDAVPIPEGESGTQGGQDGSPIEEMKDDGDEDEGNPVGRESQDAKTMNPTVEDQGNAVGGGGSDYP